MLYETELPIREDLLSAHGAVVDRWSRPGTWWTGAERLAIVTEVRRARDCETAPPPWVPVSTVEGLVSEDHVLPAAAVDAIWRLTNHPGTLTADWYRTIVPESDDKSDEADDEPVGITASQYTELVGVVAQSNSIDRFAEGLSLDRVVLPEPIDGDGGITNGQLLSRLAEAMWEGEPLALAAVRDEVTAVMGGDALVDAVAVSANFHMMTRIADGTGTPLDGSRLDATEEVRSQIGVDDFVSRRQTTST